MPPKCNGYKKIKEYQFPKYKIFKKNLNVKNEYFVSNIAPSMIAST